MAQRLEAGTLVALAEKDAALAGQAELLRSMLEGVAGNAMLVGRREIEVGIGAITATCGSCGRFCCEVGETTTPLFTTTPNRTAAFGSENGSARLAIDTTEV